MKKRSKKNSGKLFAVIGIVIVILCSIFQIISNVAFNSEPWYSNMLIYVVCSMTVIQSAVNALRGDKDKRGGDSDGK
jgi:hypothetical protein